MMLLWSTFAGINEALPPLISAMIIEIELSFCSQITLKKLSPVLALQIASLGLYVGVVMFETDLFNQSTARENTASKMEDNEIYIIVNGNLFTD